MKNFLGLVSAVIVIYLGVAAYGDIKTFEASLNTSETVTPVMLGAMYDAFMSVAVFFIVMLVWTRDSK